MYSKRTLIVVVLVALITAFASFRVKAEPSIRDCINSHELKSMAVGAAYGLGVGTSVGLVAWAAAPAGAIASPFAVVAWNGVYGGALGLGSTAMSKVYDNMKTDSSVFYDYCVKQKALGLFDSAKKSLKDLTK